MTGQNFAFGERRSDKLDGNINMRAIGVRATQWEHPMYGMFFLTEELKKVSGNILKTPKKAREAYALSITAMAMQHNYQQDWWVNNIETDASDGLIMTFLEVEQGDITTMKGTVREVEVVEHRNEADEIYATLLKKISGTAYGVDTILVCLALTRGIVDYESLSKRLQETTSSFEEIFIVFPGSSVSHAVSQTETLHYTYTLVQVLPKFVSMSFDYRVLFKDFEEKYKIGRECRGIEGNQIVYRTRNKRAISAK